MKGEAICVGEPMFYSGRGKKEEPARWAVLLSFRRYRPSGGLSSAAGRSLKASRRPSPCCCQCSISQSPTTKLTDGDHGERFREVASAVTRAAYCLARTGLAVLRLINGPLRY